MPVWGLSRPVSGGPGGPPGGKIDRDYSRDRFRARTTEHKAFLKSAVNKGGPRPPRKWRFSSFLGQIRRILRRGEKIEDFRIKMCPFLSLKKIFRKIFASVDKNKLLRLKIGVWWFRAGLLIKNFWNPSPRWVRYRRKDESGVRPSAWHAVTRCNCGECWPMAKMRSYSEYVVDLLTITKSK